MQATNSNRCPVLDNYKNPGNASSHVCDINIFDTENVEDHGIFPVQSILNAITSHIILLDGKGVILAASQPWLHLIEDINGKPITVTDSIHVGTNYITLHEINDNVSSKEKIAFQKGMLAVLDGLIPCFSMEYQCISSRSNHWFRMDCRPVAFGATRGAVVTHTNITKMKRADAELRISAVAFESQQGMLITDAMCKIIRVNKAFTDITGFSAEEALGKNPCILNSGRHNSGFYESMWSSIKTTGSWCGEIWNLRKNGQIYPEWLTISMVKNESDIVTNYVAVFSDISDIKSAEDRISNLALYDWLTTLPNRRLLMDKFEVAMALCLSSKTKGALIFVNLDRFKLINETYGHSQGDMILVEVAKRLKSCINDSDTVARFGNDEFIVILAELSTCPLIAESDAKAIGCAIQTSLNQSYSSDTNEIYCTPSIGITLFGSIKDGDIDQPLKRANFAMNQARQSGPNNLRFFDPKMQADVTRRVELEKGLRVAIQNDQLVLYYQAQVGKNRMLKGAEALVRWNHPERGIINPIEFIPLAEDTGLICPLGHWVLSAACAQLAEWGNNPEMSHLTISVNVSAREFNQVDFLEQVMDVIRRTSVNPHRLKMELTESILVTDVEGVILKMNRLKEIGIGLSLDDFGTGYSSLSYLKRLPLDQLKIDQGFIKNILTDANDAAIAKMVISLAESLGLAVIAEGVETDEQRDFLEGNGCDAYQGYLFSRPLPLLGFESFSKSLRS